MEQEKKAQSAHCLVIPFPLQGHINPMLQFSKRLQYKGVKVTLALTQYLYNTTPHSATSISVQPFSDGYDDVLGYTQEQNHDLYFKTFQTVGSKTLSDLIIRLKGIGVPVNCVIYDAFMPWILDIAKKFGLVGAVFFTQSCAVGNIYYHAFKGNLKVPFEGQEVVLPGLLPLDACDLPSFVYDIGSDQAIVRMIINQFCNIDKVDWVLCNTVYELEKQEVDWMSQICHVRTIGPTIPSMYLDKRLEEDREYGLSMYLPKTDTCMKWLNDQLDKSVVYVSFGSLAKLDFEQMKELAWGLKRSNYHFLWVVRKSEEAKLPKNFIEGTSDKGLVISWCPQLDVLSHKAIGCFVTHSGWNSTLESLSLGVAMVTIPQWSDQSTNAKYVMDVWEMGIKPKIDDKGIVNENAISECIREVMETETGKGIHNNAAKWKELIVEATDDGGSSDRNIDEIIATLV